MGIAHEIEHDAIHRLYFTRNKPAQHVMFAVVWLLRPYTDQPVGAPPVHLLHHEVSGRGSATSRRRGSPTASRGTSNGWSQ